ncbi:hypothetical protein FRB94_014537 [Tulasnella sp. JGI-2019a]|nr:hypothetical protein FRB94_014537 [Tulasnella sp. JGI-2019a]
MRIPITSLFTALAISTPFVFAAPTTSTSIRRLEARSFLDHEQLVEAWDDFKCSAKYTWQRFKCFTGGHNGLIYWYSAFKESL